MNSNTRNAVVGVDLGSTGDDAVMQGLRLLQSGAVERVHLLHVVDPKSLMDGNLFENEERALATAPERAELRAATLCRAHGINVELQHIRGHARIGAAADALLQMCVDYDSDYLIVGTHGRQGIDRLLEGSVAEAVVRRARCPVLIAREKSYRGLARTVLPDSPYLPGEAPRREQREDTHIQASTTADSWHPADNGPTGFRIV